MFPIRSSVLRCAWLVFGLLCVTAIARPAFAGFTVFTVGGDTTQASIQPTVDAFRAAIGGSNNGNSAGSQGSGRREINWDGGGATTASPVGTPMATFQNRGVTLTTSGTGFLQTTLDATELTSINASYQTEFGTFSPLRIFTPLGSNVTDATFSLPGSGGAIPATVSAFGAVFSDVDSSTATKIQFFDRAGNSLVTFGVPTDTVGDAGLSFVGALANAGERIARVRITTGNSALGPTDQDGDSVDVVVMDDFILAEPVPEPTTLLLAAAGLVGAMILRACRRN